MHRIAALSLAALLLAPGLWAQARLTGADLTGTVLDESGGVLPGAAVTVTNLDTNVARTATTDAKGRYTVAALPPASYRVTVELTSFAAQTREGLALSLGQAAEVDFTMKVARTTESLVVIGDAPVVDIRDTSVSTTINQSQIENLPINGRNFLAFSLLTPATGNDRSGVATGSAAASGLSFAGQRGRSNNLMVDGLDNNDGAVGGIRQVFGQEAIQEFQVLTNSYSPEFGRASGGVVNIITKSGTNRYHGNAFMFFRDKSLNAKDFFERYSGYDPQGNPVGPALNNDKAPFSQKQFGATLGGPLRKDRTFFFLSFERTDQQNNNIVTIRPDVAAAIRAAGFPVETGSQPWAFKQTAVIGKIDQQWSANHNLVFRANYADTTNENIQAWGGQADRSRGGVNLRKDLSLSLSETDILSPRWVNEARFQFARQDSKVQSLDPRCAPCAGEDNIPVQVTIVGFAAVGNQEYLPQPRKNDRMQLLDTISFFQGNHSAKAGVEGNLVINDKNFGGLPLYFGGAFYFVAFPGTNAFQNFQAGIPYSYVQGYGDSGTGYNAKDFAAFVQDDWKVTRRLTLKGGVRYQRQIWPDFQWDISNLGGTRLRYGTPQDSNNFAPRVSAAFDLTGDGKTSLHAAYGLFHDNQIGALVGVANIYNGITERLLVVNIVENPSLLLRAWNSPGHRLPAEPVGQYSSGVNAIDPNLQTPYSRQGSVGITHAFSRDFAVEVNGLWVHGYKLPGSLEYNPINTVTGRRPNDLPCSADPTRRCVNGGIPGTSGSVIQFTSFGETWYKGLAVSLTKRYSHRTEFMVSYTLSKAEDDSTDYINAVAENLGQGRNPADPNGLPLGYDPYAERALSVQDQRHRFVFSGLVRLPADFMLSSIVRASSGPHFTPTAGTDYNLDSFFNERARTNPADPSTSVRRNVADLPGFFSVDARLSRRFKLGKQASLEAIVEGFNLLDRANFIVANGVFGTQAYPTQPADGYGNFTVAAPPRQLQLAARLSF